MTLLYAIVKKVDAVALQRGEWSLSDCLNDSNHAGNGVVELTASLLVPRDLNSTVVELAFQDGESLGPYVLTITDAPTTFALPPAILSQGKLRLLSESEIMAAAREELECCPAPSSMPLWRWIRKTPADERMEHYGPCLIRSTLNEARELGLVEDALLDDLTREAMIELLTRVVHTTDRTTKVSTETISESLKELSGLEKEEAFISQELTGLRRRFAEMRRLRDSTSNYQEALKIQRDRLKVSDWLFEIHTGTEKCPICQNEMDQSGDEIHRLRTALDELEKTSAGVKEIPASFEREFQRVQEALQVTTEKLRAVEIRRTALTSRSREAERRQFEIKQVERFIGRLESDLKTYERLGVDNQLSAEVQTLRDRVTALKAQVDAADVKRAVQRALRIVNSNAARLLPGLDVEYPDSPVQLDISNLTVKVTRERRDDFLWEIGSGSNWLSYHLAATLGLQQFFMAQPQSVVPSMLVLDQPSQVYFPKLLIQKAGLDMPEPQFDRDEDVAAIRKAFSVISNVVTAANGKLQAIVLDHAPEAVWGGLPNVHLVEEWRDGKYLVPAEWLK